MFYKTLIASRIVPGGFLAHRPSYVLPAMVGLSAELLILVLGPEWLEGLGRGEDLVEDAKVGHEKKCSFLLRNPAGFGQCSG